MCIGGGASSGELLARVPTFVPFGTFKRFFSKSHQFPEMGLQKIRIPNKGESKLWILLFLSARFHLGESWYV